MTFHACKGYSHAYLFQKFKVYNSENESPNLLSCIKCNFICLDTEKSSLINFFPAIKLNFI